MQIPRPGDDRPPVARVLLLTVVGFAVGVLWPRLAGFKLVPSVPAEAETAASAEEPRAAAPASAPAPPPAARAVPADPPPTTAEPTDRLQLSPAKVTSCRDARGGKKDGCDTPDIDGAARPKILALATCPAAQNLAGKLSLGLELDFDAGKVTEVLKGKSTTVPAATADALIVCARKEFATLSLADVKHAHARYTVFYLVDFLAPGDRPAGEGDAGTPVTPARGRATVAWEVAIVRDQPKDGEIVARLMRGTKVVVTGRDGDWYRIKYDAKGTEGWVFRTAIGL